LGVTVELLVRLVISMTVVMAVMALAAKFVRRRQGLGPMPRALPRSSGRGMGSNGQGAGAGSAGNLRGGNRRARPEAPLDVVYRRSLAKGAWVTLVEAGGKRFLVGVTEQSVTLLAELPGAEVPSPVPPPGSVVIVDDEQDWSRAGRMPASGGGSGDGSPDHAWKLALDSLRERTVRR
jgi:hypothetical protein